LEVLPVFQERITRHYQSLSPSYKKIADFVLASHQRVAFMSASRLAKHLGVDVATVTRFSQQIGYEGYVELIREIQDQVLEEMSEARAPVSERLATAKGLVPQTLWRDWATLEKTILNVSGEYADRAVEALRRAERIYLVSEGVGGALAQAAASYLRMYKRDVVVLAGSPFDMALSLKEIKAEDALVGIGFTNYAYGATRALEVARQVGAPTIGIISQADCPVGEVAELLFSCAATEEGYLPSLTSVGAILFALVYAVALTEPEAYSRALLDFQNTYADLTEGTTRGDEEVVEDLMGLF
jgi:DNA-binding MurR/RpiR family transcriptional regulator